MDQFYTLLVLQSTFNQHDTKEKIVDGIVANQTCIYPDISKVYQCFVRRGIAINYEKGRADNQTCKEKKDQESLNPLHLSLFLIKYLFECLVVTNGGSLRVD